MLAVSAFRWRVYWSFKFLLDCKKKILKENPSSFLNTLLSLFLLKFVLSLSWSKVYDKFLSVKYYFYWASLVAQWSTYHWGKNPPTNSGNIGLIPESGRSSEKGNGNPLQYSCLRNPMERGAWRATDHRVAKSQSDMTEQLSTHTNTY